MPFSETGFFLPGPEKRGISAVSSLVGKTRTSWPNISSTDPVPKQPRQYRRAIQCKVGSIKKRFGSVRETSCRVTL